MPTYVLGYTLRKHKCLHTLYDITLKVSENIHNMSTDLYITFDYNEFIHRINSVNNHFYYNMVGGMKHERKIQSSL